MANGNVQFGTDPLLTNVIADISQYMPSLFTETFPVGRGTPRVDGVMSDGEWINAQRFDFPIDVSGAGTSTASVFVLHDNINIYFAFKARSPAPRALVERQVLFFLSFWSNASEGPWPQKSSDELVFSKWDASNPVGRNLIGPGRLDDWAYRSPCPLSSAPSYCGTRDTRFGGTIDGAGTSTVDDLEFVAELWHPLRSADSENDFQVRSGDTVGWSIDLLISGTATDGSGTPNTRVQFPAMSGAQRTWLGLNLR
jgi:hypothetical protein